MLNDLSNISFLDQYINSKVDEIVNRIVIKLEGNISSSGDNTDALERLRTNKEVQHRYQISYSTLKKLRDKNLPSYLIGSDYRYKFSELDLFFQNKR